MLTDALIVAFIYSFAKVLGDLRRDTSTANAVYRFMQRIGLGAWYIGGNERYNPSLPWTCDFWHETEHIRTSCVACLCVAFLPIAWWWKVPLFVAFYGLIGNNFELWYRFIWPDAKAGTIWDFVRQRFYFWKNWHAEGGSKPV